jgi:hypothetical protein
MKTIRAYQARASLLPIKLAVVTAVDIGKYANTEAKTSLSIEARNGWLETQTARQPCVL